MDLISVITTVYNGSDVISDCLESVIGQNYSKIERIIIDGNSVDGTLDVVSKYQSQIHTLISEPDEGIYDGMNNGLQVATGDIIGFLNADDFYAHPNVLSDVAEVFTDKKVDSCFGDLLYVDANDKKKILRYWRSGEFTRNKLYWGWMPPHPTFFVRRSVYEKFGNFNLGLGSAADYEIMLRFLFRHRITTVYIPEVLVMMRSGGVSNATVMNRLRANQMDRKAWRVNELRPLPWTLLAKPLRKIGQWFGDPPHF